MKTENIVIVGSGVAGCEIASSLMKSGRHYAITMVSHENAGLYDKPSLSKLFLSGEKSILDITQKSPGDLQASGIKTIFSEPVINIDTSSSTALLGDGRQLIYDKLILATGGRSKTLGIEGEGFRNVAYLRTLQDALDIQAQLNNVQRIVIVGGGFVGLEVATSLRKLGKDVMVLERSERLLNRLNSNILSQRLEEVLVASGVKLAYYKSAARFVRQQEALNSEQRKNAKIVECDDGTQYAADFFIVGVGMTPNVDLAQRAGLAINGGIAVNERGETSAPNIYAVGDCASIFDAATGSYFCAESIQSSISQAKNTAACIAGGNPVSPGVPTFWTEIGGMRIQMFGFSHRYDEVIIQGDLEQHRFTIFYSLNNKVVAAHVFNHPANLIVARNAVANHVPIAALANNQDINPMTIAA